MKHIFLFLPFVFALQTSPLAAQAETAHHRKVYAEINEKVDSYKTVSTELENENALIELTGWSDEGELKKITAIANGEHGNITGEYYIEDGLPLFVYTVTATENIETGEVVARTENRYYFDGEAMVKWLSGKEEPFEPGSRDFNITAESVVASFDQYKNALAKKVDGKKAGAVQHTTGKFTGIEEGDYFHWLMTEEDGSETSFFIIRDEGSVGKVLEDPDAFVGRKCRVAHTTSMVDIPEAGGKTEITQITGVEWFE